MSRLFTFVAAPGSPRPLGFFRVGLAALLLVQAWTLSGHLLLLFDDRGLAPWSLTEPSASAWMPHIGTVVRALWPLDLASRECIQGLGTVYGLALVGLLLGWRTRGCAALAWVLHTMWLNSAPLFSYGFDLFAHIGLFYAVVMPVGAAYSLDVRAGRVSGEPSAAATLALRVLQVHLCVVYFTTGVEKAMGTTWQEGTAIWEAVMQPQFARFDFSWLAWHPWVVRVATWSTLIIEVGYAVFVWPRRTRPVWVLLTVGLHGGIALFMGLWLFSGIMALLTLAAFGGEIDPRPVRSVLSNQAARDASTRGTRGCEQDDQQVDSRGSVVLRAECDRRDRGARTHAVSPCGAHPGADPGGWTTGRSRLD